jgi:hypothetical protein
MKRAEEAQHVTGCSWSIAIHRGGKDASGRPVNPPVREGPGNVAPDPQLPPAGRCRLTRAELQAVRLSELDRLNATIQRAHMVNLMHLMPTPERHQPPVPAIQTIEQELLLCTCNLADPSTDSSDFVHDQQALTATKLRISHRVSDIQISAAIRSQPGGRERTLLQAGGLSAAAQPTGSCLQMWAQTLVGWVFDADSMGTSRSAVPPHHPGHAPDQQKARLHAESAGPGSSYLTPDQNKKVEGHQLSTIRAEWY